MSIITSKSIYARCINEPWAVGGFIGYNMEIMQASVEAAVNVGAPAMIQNSCRVIEYAGATMLRKMAEACSEMYDTDIILHVDHGDSVDLCKRCIDQGFTSVMLECTANKSYAQMVRETKQVVEYAHQNGVVVEGEIFHCVETEDRVWTDVDEAKSFVEETGCDSLSISCGNTHGLPAQYPKKLKVEQIRAIHTAIPNMPLVLHATSILKESTIERVNRVGGGIQQPLNFSLQDLQASFSHGVAKVNSALDIKYIYSAAMRDYMLRNPQKLDPRLYTGYARDEIKQYIASKHIEIFHDNDIMKGNGK